MNAGNITNQDTDMNEKPVRKTKKLTDIPRQKMPEQDPLERISNYMEVPHGYSVETAMKEAERCIQCKKPKCVDGCPVGIDIPEFIYLIEQGDLRGAIRKMKETNVLPAVCGRVCPQEDQCEVVCVIGKKGEPVAIGRLERFIADWEREQGEIEIPECAPPTGRRVAVVGSGPAGLAVAADLAKSGHSVTVFEALHETGGVLVYGIPEFRLPKSIVKLEVQNLEKMGVEFKTNFVVGMTATVDELFELGYEAVFIGTGAGLPYFMNIPGENLNGVYSANEYLTRANLMKAYLFPETDTPIARSRNVAVIGGGNTAMDAARNALRLGAENVYVVYRRSRVEMPARVEEIHHAEEEGIQFTFLANPVRIHGDENGWATSMECIRMELGEPDASGRRRPVPIEGSEYTFDVDTIIISIGNGANPLVPGTTPGLDTKKWGTIIAEEGTGKTSKKGVFAGGDIVIGAATVILAMGAGRQSAAAINQYLEDGVW